jgi:2'-5' RNA ligase
MLAVVAFPVLAEADGRKIEAVRRRHDPNAERIAAHFTLVFPTKAVARQALEERMAALAAATPAFAVGLRRILVHREGAEAFVYLVPEQGYDALVEMHGHLNGAAAEKAAFTPHLTIARLPDRTQARTLATALASDHLAATGRVEALSLVDVPDSGAVRTMQVTTLRG